MIQNFIDWIAGHEDSLSRNTLLHEILFASMCIGHQHVAGVIDDPPVDFLGDSVIIAPIPGLHVIYRDAQSFCTYRAQTAIRVS